MSQLPRALGRLLPGWRAGGAGPGGARGAWAAPAGRARGWGVTEPPPATPGRPAGADSLVSPVLSNCLAVQAPCPETAAGTGRGGVRRAGRSARSAVEPRSRAPGAEQRPGQSGKAAGASPAPRHPARNPVLRPRPSWLGARCLGGRWGARQAQPHGGAGRARRGARRDRSNRRRGARLGVLSTDRAGWGTPRSAWGRGAGARVAAGW